MSVLCACRIVTGNHDLSPCRVGGVCECIDALSAELTASGAGYATPSYCKDVGLCLANRIAAPAWQLGAITQHSVPLACAEKAIVGAVLGQHAADATMQAQEAGSSIWLGWVGHAAPLYSMLTPDGCVIDACMQ